MRHGSFVLVTGMIIIMGHFNGEAHHKRNDNYSLGITALSCWRCENFLLLFPLPLIQPCGLCMLFFLFKSFPRDVLSFEIPMFKFVDDEAIRKISETLVPSTLGSPVLFPGRIVSTFDTVEIYRKRVFNILDILLLAFHTYGLYCALIV